MIKDLYFAIIKAYKEVYAEKIEAKGKIKEIKNLLKEWENRAKDIENIENLLSVNWHYLPIKQRKDYIQKTYDLIHYGFDVEYHDDGRRTYYGGYDFGLKKMYWNIVDVLQSYNDNMKSLYKKHKYDNVIQVYDECVDNIDSLLEKYGILEKSNNNE